MSASCFEVWKTRCYVVEKLMDRWEWIILQGKEESKSKQQESYDVRYKKHDRNCKVDTVTWYMP